MQVVCEKCGSKYSLDDSKIAGAKAVAKCKFCGNSIAVTKSSPFSFSSARSKVLEEKKTSPLEISVAESPPDEVQGGASKRRFGLREKMMILLFIIPILLIGASAVIYINQLQNYSQVMTAEHSLFAQSMAEEVIKQQSLAVTHEIELYLQMHPNLQVTELASDNEFIQFAVQKIGQTGYTSLAQFSADASSWVVRASLERRIVGTDPVGNAKGKTDVENYRLYKDLYDKAATADGVTAGYYRSFANDRQIFQVIEPVRKTDLYVIATAYADEFTEPMRQLDQRSKDLGAKIVRTMQIILLITVLFIAYVVVWYSGRISSDVRLLTEVTNRISVGELDIEIPIKSRDELGDLAEAIDRMQQSIKISLDRLRRKRLR